jgi:hypothetical protein
MLTFTIGFDFNLKPVPLYVGDDFAKANFAADVGAESGRFHHVDVYLNPTPEIVVDLTDSKL